MIIVFTSKKDRMTTSNMKVLTNTDKTLIPPDTSGVSGGISVLLAIKAWLKLDPTVRTLTQR